MKPIVLIGGGGHCKSVIDVIEQQGEYEIAGIVDRQETLDDYVLDHPVIGDDSILSELVKKYTNFAITVGHLKTNTVRLRLYQRLKELGAEFPILISPKAYVSMHANLGEGTVVFHGAIVNAGARTGTCTIINTQSVVEHDVSIDKNSHVSTGAIVNGNCTIGNNCFIGSHSVIIQGKKIGDDIIIGANATVVDDLQKPGMYVGSPARKIND